MIVKGYFIIAMVILIAGCSSQKDDPNKIYYIIKHMPVEVVLHKEGMPPPPPFVQFYGDYNFILLDGTKIFYHREVKRYSCLNGFNHSKPFQLNLRPERITEIKINDLETFLNAIPDSILTHLNFNASVSSPKDTIRNKAFRIIADFFKSKNIKYYMKRNWTEEEQYVLTAKLENKKYDPLKVNWKIGFGDTPEFSPPADTVFLIK